MIDPPPVSGCMHPLRVYPGPEHGGSAVSTPSVVVGGELAWSDDNDATYADHSPYTSDGSTWTAQSRADFPGYESTADRKFTLQVRAQPFNPADANNFTVFIVNPTSTEGYGSWTFYPSDLSAGATTWLTSPEFTIPAGSDTVGGFFVGLNVFLNHPSATPILLLRVFDLELCWSEGGFRRPSLRQLHRGGRGGIGGIPRAVGDRTVYGSPRRGPGMVR